jgi:hypothetical protein
MKEILQLFRRDAEHAPPGPAAAQYDISKPRILKEALTSAPGSGQSSREGSITAPRKVTPPTNRPTSSSAREDAVYGRRW